MKDIAVIGGGVIGCAAAYKLSKYKLDIAVLEKENDVALGATRANSGIIHAGFDPEPGTLEARLNVSGCAQAKELAKKLNVKYKNNGSMVLAFNKEEAETVRKLYERGIKNGVPDLEILDGIEVRKREENVSENVVCALYAPSAGIIDPWDYAIAFATVAAENGTEFIFDFKVDKIERINGGFRIYSGEKTVDAKRIINAAGVHSDEIHNAVAEPEFKIVPTKGQYYLLDKSEGTRAHCTLFQCPTAAGKGVLVSPTAHGNLIVGPDATVSGDPDRVNTTGEQLEFVKNSAIKSVPDINFRNSIRNFAGMRANSDNSDFVIKIAADGFIDAAGIKSPGLSAAPAIADEITELLKKDGAELEEKQEYKTERKKIVFKDLTEEEKKEIIKKDSRYGRVICRCETVTEGEIVAAIHSPVPARTVDGVKRRCGAGMGRCQGGFCGPRVVEILARELNISPLEVKKDRGKILLEKCKEEK